jgi:Tat protein secretion system quality control protein TatD with DNase activity
VLHRARASGVERMIITGGNLNESKQALKLARQYGKFPALAVSSLLSASQTFLTQWFSLQ